jgi:APA family basic amino acid/polyamine antiporter
MTLTPFPSLVVYIGFTLNIFTVFSVVALMMFRRRAGWQKLSAVNFCYPLIPVLYILAGTWITLQGSLQRPYISLATLLTIVTGAAVYHFKLRPPQAPTSPPAVETY